MPGETKVNNSYIAKIVNERINGSKIWTRVYFDNGTIWTPALWEQGYAAQQVVLCERLKYPDLPWDAATMTIEFITKAMAGYNIESLCHQYKLTTQPSFLRLGRVLSESKNLLK
jgi:hypothetical protein